MAASSLTKVPYDVLLLIVGLLGCEDSLRLVQTCTTLYRLTDIKAFWLKIARILQQSRQLPLVHHLIPLEGFSLPELRTAIFRALKLELKWSGREGIDPSPLRSMQVEPVAHTTGRSEDDRRITWIWFLPDGIHLACVIANEVVQLWHLPTNKLILAFDTGGTLVHTSQNTASDYWTLAGSVDMDFEDSSCKFCLWKYSRNESQSREDLLPVASYWIPGRADFVFNADRFAGVVYTTAELDESFTQRENDESGFLVFQTVEWETPARIMHRFTPLGYFPVTHALQVIDDLTLFEHNSSYIIVCFNYLACATVYAYDMQSFNDFSHWGDPVQVIYPRTKIEYELHPEDGCRWLSSGLSLSWSQSKLSWNASSIGTLGYHHLVPIAGEKDGFLSATTLSLSPLATHDDSRAALPEAYRRCLVGTETSDNPFYTTKGEHLLVNSLGTCGINGVWALSHPEIPYAIQGVVIARLFSGDPSGSFDTTITKPHSPGQGLFVSPESPSTGVDRSDLELGRTVVKVNLESWIPRSESAEDICLDDRHGRVAIGTYSGKVFIFDFL